MDYWSQVIHVYTLDQNGISHSDMSTKTLDHMSAYGRFCVHIIYQLYDGVCSWSTLLAKAGNYKIVCLSSKCPNTHSHASFSFRCSGIQISIGSWKRIWAVFKFHNVEVIIQIIKLSRKSKIKGKILESWLIQVVPRDQMEPSAVKVFKFSSD